MPINSQIAYLMWLWTRWPSGSVTNLSGPWLMWWIPNKNDWLSRMAPSVSRHWNVLCLCLIAPNTDILLHLYSYRHLFTDTCLPTPVLIQMICLVRYSIFSRGFTMHLHLRLIPPIMKIWERNAKVSPDVGIACGVLRRLLQFWGKANAYIGIVKLSVWTMSTYQILPKRLYQTSFGVTIPHSQSLCLYPCRTSPYLLLAITLDLLN